MFDVRQAARQLPNGLTVVAIQRPGAGTATIAVDIRIGARFEDPRDSGLSHFLEHMVFQGCDGFDSPDAVNAAAEEIGSALDASTARDVTHFEHCVRPDRIGDSASLIAAMLRSPQFLKIESERAIILEEALDEYDEDGNLVDADTLSRAALWPKCPLGQSVIGSLKNLRRFTTDDLQRHHAHFYGAKNMIVTVVSPDPPEQALALISPSFSTLPLGELRVPSEPTQQARGPLTVVVRDGRSQIECRLLFRSAGRKDTTAIPLALLRIALDDGLTSRLHRRLGTELGLAYEQWATWEGYWDTGVFEVGAVLSPAKAIRFVREAQTLLTDLIEHPPAEDELARIKVRAEWAFRQAHDTAEGLISLYGTPRLFEAKAPCPTRVLAKVDRFTATDLATVANAVFDPTTYVGCFVGPLDKTTRRGLKSEVQRFRRRSGGLRAH